MNNFVTHLAGKKTNLDVTSSILGEKRTPADPLGAAIPPATPFLRNEKKLSDIG